MMFESRNRRSGLMAALLMGAMLSNISHGGPMGGGSEGRSFTPYPPSDEEKKRLANAAKAIQPLHRFVIGGREIWATNKKNALKKARKH